MIFWIDRMSEKFSFDWGSKSNERKRKLKVGCREELIGFGWPWYFRIGFRSGFGCKNAARCEHWLGLLTKKSKKTVMDVKMSFVKHSSWITQLCLILAPGLIVCKLLSHKKENFNICDHDNATTSSFWWNSVKTSTNHKTKFSCRISPRTGRQHTERRFIFVSERFRGRLFTRVRPMELNFICLHLPLASDRTLWDVQVHSIRKHLQSIVKLSCSHFHMPISNVQLMIMFTLTYSAISW